MIRKPPRWHDTSSNGNAPRQSLRAPSLHSAIAASLTILALSGGCNPELMRGGWGGGNLFGGPPGKGEPWAVEVIALDSAERKEIIDEAAESLRRTSGIRANDVVVEHNPTSSRILYGRYMRQRRSDSLRLGPSKEMENDLLLI